MEPTSAKQILLERGHGYLYKKKYPQVIVFTRSVVDIDKLERAFGGNHHKHNSGIIWILCNKQKLRAMLQKIAPTRSHHEFEAVIEPYLGE
jgi:hypothetical protein